MDHTSFWERWKQTITLGLVLAAMQLMVAAFLVKHVDHRLGALEASATSAGKGSGVGAPAVRKGEDGTMGPRVYDPDDAPPKDVPSSLFDDELRSWLAAALEKKGADLADFGDPEEIYREAERLDVLLPPSDVAKLVANQAPELEDPAGKDYVRGMLLLHLLSEVRQEPIPMGGPIGEPSHTASRPLDPKDKMGQVTPGDISALDALLAERLERQAQEAGIDPTTLMPSDEMREAAKASAELESDATRALLEAYTAAFDSLAR